MRNTYSLTELFDKRSELAGEIVQAEKRIRDLRADLAHIEATLRILRPGIELEKVVPKHVEYRPRYFKRGELAKTIRNYMREHAGEEIAVADIVPLAIGDRTLSEPEKYRVAVGVYEALKRLQRKATVTNTGGDGWKDARWRLT